MRSGWRILILSFVVSGLLISPVLNLPLVSAQSEEDELRRLYDNNELFEQLSGAARSMLEAKFGRKPEPAAEASLAALEDALSAPLEQLGYVGNVLVNDPNLDLTNRDTQSETTIVLFPSGVCVGHNDSGSFIPPGTPPGNKFTGFSRSTDGGASFTDKETLPTNPGGDAGDPVLARDNGSGRIYFATLGFNVSNIQVFPSDDDCNTFGPPVNGTPGPGFQDKEWITVDNFSGPGQGNVYLVTRNFGAGNGIFFFRSIDGGNTFSPNGGTLIASGSPVNVQGAFVTVGPDHAVYVFFFDENSQPERIRMRKSADQGLTFGPVVDVATLGTGPGFNGDLGLTGRRDGTATFAGFRSNAFPQAVVNPVSGNIYVTYTDNPAGVDKADILFRQSTDGGFTWSAPVRVNDDATTNDQWFPAVAVTPDGARLGVFWYDRRLDSANNFIDRFGVTGDINNNTVTFGPNFRITDESFPPEFGRDPLIVSTYMGDYDQAVADNSFFYVVWGDNRLQNPNFPARIRQADVRFAKIEIPGRPTLVNAELSGTPDPDTFAFDPTPVAEGPEGTFSFTSAFCNIGSKRLTELKSVTTVLTGGNALLNRNSGTPPGVGSELTFPPNRDYVDLILDPGECVDVPYRIGLATRDPFDFFVDVFGVARVGGPYAANY
jgi:hypothetical protein